MITFVVALKYPSISLALTSALAFFYLMRSSGDSFGEHVAVRCRARE